jgi:uncharacterized BrkB/YihY/UPF0761 family membrane protein
MINNDIKKVESEILKKISKGEIKPRPKWFFFLKELFFWVVCAFLVLVASLFLSVFLHMITDGDEYAFLGMKLFAGDYEYLTYAFFWIVLFLFVALLAYFDFLKTKNSHRIFTKATYIVIVLYIILASVFHYNNYCETVRKIVIDSIPFYHDFLSKENVGLEQSII